MEEQRRRRTQADLQNRYQQDLEREKMVSPPRSVETSKKHQKTPQMFTCVVCV